MGKALERAGNPSNHEEGGFWGLDENGNEFVSHAKPGAPADPSKDDKAQVNVFTPADISDLDKVAVIVGSFHTHPNGTVIEGGLDFNKIGGATKTSSWGNEPSSDDLANAKENRQGVTGNRYVLAQGNNTVYIYNGDGVKATFPLKQFIPEKK
jgi:hypothetical protein